LSPPQAAAAAAAASPAEPALTAAQKALRSKPSRSPEDPEKKVSPSSNFHAIFCTVGAPALLALHCRLES
jgi:hypothetical protein